MHENVLAKTVNTFPEKWRILKYPFCDISEWYYLSVASNGNNNFANHETKLQKDTIGDRGWRFLVTSWMPQETFYFHEIFNIWLTV